MIWICGGSGIHRRKCLKQKTKKKIQQNVWGIGLVSLKKEQVCFACPPLYMGRKKLFLCCQKEESEHWCDDGAVCEGKVVCKLLLQNHQEDRTETVDYLDLALIYPNLPNFKSWLCWRIWAKNSVTYFWEIILLRTWWARQPMIPS